MIEQIQKFIANPSAIEFIGLLGAVLLALCGLPEMVYCIRNKKCRVSTSLLWLWYGGEISAFIYVVALGDFILTFNYFCNIIILTTCVYYWTKERLWK